jgi:outer membrane protein assembly factor BamD
MLFSPCRRARAGVSAVALVALVALFAGCASKDDTANRSPEKLYAEAMEAIEGGNYETAVKSLERVEGLGAGTLLAQQAQLQLAWAQWRLGEKAQALTIIERFIKLNPSSPALDYAMYLRGLINFNEDLGFLGKYAGQDISERDQRAARDSLAAFRQLVEQFPESKYSDDARGRIQFIMNSLAAYEVHVASYYLRRGAYLAAANRAQQTVTDFQASPATEEALYIMVVAYDKLELPQLRDDADRVLRLNYPNSRFRTEGLSARERPWWKLF